MSAEIDRRLAAIEQRLAQLEAHFERSEQRRENSPPRASQPVPITPNPSEADSIQSIESNSIAPIERTESQAKNSPELPAEVDLNTSELTEEEPPVQSTESDSPPSTEYSGDSPEYSVEDYLAFKPVTPHPSEATPPSQTIKSASSPEITSIEPTATSPITKILGWGGATAFVLAAAYLIRLAIADGWFKGLFTPTRQVTVAILAGLALIGAGLWLKKRDREYASLLPAGGLVILFLSIYGAHLYYGLINEKIAGIGVMAVCIGALSLCREFKSQLYAFFAVMGSYSAPFLLGSGSGQIIDLVTYYSCWSLVFCLFSIQLRSRGIYFVALYMGLIGFGVLWWTVAPDAWIPALIFQFLQLIIFSFCAALYALKHHEPMTTKTAVTYVPALLIFYGLQYAILAEHLPSFAPWIALVSAGILLVSYQFARRDFPEALGGNQWLLKAYCALILLHAGYWDSTPEGWRPWVAPGLLIIATIYQRWQPKSDLLAGPIAWTIRTIFIGNYLRLVFDYQLETVPGQSWLLILYALQLYWLYALERKEQRLFSYQPLLLYSGHVAIMAAPFYLFSNQLVISGVWGSLAIAYLLLALKITDRALGQSAILIGCISTIIVPGGWGPWFVLGLIMLAMVYRRWQPESKPLDAAIAWLIGIISAGNYLRVILDLQVVGDIALDTVPAQNWLLLLYALQLYWLYILIRKEEYLFNYQPLLLYSGHIAIMAAPFYLFSNQLIVSGIWGLLAIAYLLLALRITDRTLGQSALLIGCASAVTVSGGWGPWFMLALITLASIYQHWQPKFEQSDVAIAWLIGIIFSENYLQIVLDSKLIEDVSLNAVPGQSWLLILYAVQLYYLYSLIRKQPSLSGYGLLFLYSGHGAAMAAPFQMFANEFVVSLAWGLLAIACLLLALQITNKTLGQSSLLIFGISAIKVFIFDLAGTTPLVRIGCLVALGMSLYLGGWLYKQIEQIEA